MWTAFPGSIFELCEITWNWKYLVIITKNKFLQITVRQPATVSEVSRVKMFLRLHSIAWYFSGASWQESSYLLVKKNTRALLFCSQFFFYDLPQVKVRVWTCPCTVNMRAVMTQRGRRHPSANLPAVRKPHSLLSHYRASNCKDQQRQCVWSHDDNRAT